MNVQVPAPARSRTSTLIIPTLTPTPITPTLTPTPNDHFDFASLIVDLKSNAPGPYSEGFQLPDDAAKLAFHSIALSMLFDDTKPAYRFTAQYGYELTSLFDLGDANAESYVLREQHPVERGWGMYFFRKNNVRDIVVEAPHPLTDVNTPAVALDLYRALQAKALFVSGTHRDANVDGTSDPTHAVDTIFQTMHTTLFMPTGQPMEQTIFLQVHGYSAQDHPSYPQVVIGYNWENDPEKDQLLEQIITTLQEYGVTTGLCAGRSFQGLCGTTNVQRQAMAGGIFIHMELGLALRQDDAKFVEAMQKALNP